MSLWYCVSDCDDQEKSNPVTVSLLQLTDRVPHHVGAQRKEVVMKQTLPFVHRCISSNAENINTDYYHYVVWEYKNYLLKTSMKSGSDQGASIS